MVLLHSKELYTPPRPSEKKNKKQKESGFPIRPQAIISLITSQNKIITNVISSIFPFSHFGMPEEIIFLRVFLKQSKLEKMTLTFETQDKWFG